MFWASHLLATLAVVLAWPAPIALSRAKWPARSPFTAMILWQAIALAGGLSMIGAMLVWGLEPLGDNLLEALGALWDVVVNNRPAETLGLVHVFALSAASLLTAHLVFTLLLTYARIRGQRRRHRNLLNLLSSPSHGNPSTLVIKHPAPVAYCLPGGARSVTVLSDGLMGLLSEDELQAVLIHERAHLKQRHHLLLWAFAAWRSALPWLPTSQLAQRAVNELIEMLADDEAVKQVDEKVLVGAIAIVASGSHGPAMDGSRRDAPVADGSDAGSAVGRPRVDAAPSAPDEEPGAEGSSVATVHRLRRLLEPQPPLSNVQTIGALTAAALLLTAPTVLLIAPGFFG
ncbi:Zn-dependent protease with chaperone function [Arthrobacter pigmenti]|uniref:Zn-dependent protease with chaperone function n=1 Tax=Arthrobacter pigmenti TaxID=271432 RepID=A0A846RQX1_9MICC|nr:M56 family metallopeptidase [Arthrobacter pigmenti]NJC22125.1 Zn-dependent protease with chaperone function [Arthrobacter pigmenti]